MSKKKVSNDWDVEQYRHPWDSEEQWEVRRQFMLTHKDSIPEEKLVCFAQVYANMEILQCRYPPEVTELVNKLADGVNEDYHKNRKAKQGVAFVKASEDSDSCKTFKGNQPRGAETTNPKAKRPRWEAPVQIQKQSNRPSAADYFEQSKHSSTETFEPERNRSTSKYQIQSYYTSTYKSKQRQQNDLPTAGASGPGEVPIQRPEIVDVRAGGFGTVPVERHQPAGLHPNNTNPCQNHMPGRTTAFSGKSTRDREVADIQQQFLNLVKYLSKCRPKATTTRWWLNDCVQRTNMKINFPICAVPKPKRHDPSFNCQLLINGVIVAETLGPSKKLSSDAAYELAVKKLLQPDIRIERNAENRFVVVVSDPSLSNASSPGPSEPVLSTLYKDVSNSTRPSSARPILLQEKFRNFIIVHPADIPSGQSPVSILYNSASFNKAELTFTFSETHCRCVVQLDELVLGEGSGVTRQQSKLAAAEAALEKLRSVAYTLVVKHFVFPDSQVSRGKLFTLQNDDSIPEDNVGNKLLRLLGWTGGSLGKTGNGVSEPIRVEQIRGRQDRQGLGHLNSVGVTADFCRKTTTIIDDYAKSDTDMDLVFSPEFTSEERAQMHLIAHRFGLKSCSRGKGTNRQLILSKRLNPRQLLYRLMNQGGSSDKYHLIPPGGQNNHT